MAKNLQLIIVATIIAATLLLISAVKTTNAAVTNEGSQLSSRCKRQLQWQKMDHCRHYLNSEMELIMYNTGNQACCLRECCEMLQDMDEGCVCEAVETVAEEVTGGERWRGMGRVVVRKKAMQLPGRCGIRVRCEASHDYYYSTNFY